MEKVAIITGASRGIGAATARLLAQNNYKVVVNYYQNDTAANSVVSTITDAGGKAISIKADVSNEQDVINLFEQTKIEFGLVSALVNNAGINGGNCSIEDITADKLETVFGTIVFGSFYCCREAIKQMKQHGGGNIVNVSSEAAKFGGTRLAHYAAAKAAINTFTIACAREVAEYNIRVNVVSPGVIETEMHHDSNKLEKLIASLPMKQMGKPEEVAETVLWLVSDQASYVSGANIAVSGAR